MRAICLMLTFALMFVGMSLFSYAAAQASPNVISAPALKWQRGGCFASWCQTGWYASPAVADLNNDGQPDVIWGAYDVVVLDGATGALTWRAANDSRVWPGVAVVDLTGDGSREVIVGRGADQVTVYDANGGTVWTRNPFGNGEVRTLAVADLENDGNHEVLAGRASGGATKQLSVFEANGAVRAGWPARRDGEAGYGWGMYNQNIAVGDLNNDGFKEIIGPTDTHYITALDRNGNQLPANAIYNNSNPRGAKVWSQVGVHVDHAVDLRGYANCGTEHRPNFANSAPAIGDLDNDGVNEVVVIGNVYDCAASPYKSLYEMPFVLKADRSRWSSAGFDWTILPSPPVNATPLSEDYNVIESVAPNAVIADLDGDSRKEILFPSYDGRLHAYWLDKTQHGNWPFDVPGSGIRFASEPAVADLDNDGKAEVIFTSWPQKGGVAVGQLHIVDAQGTQLHAVDLPPSFPAGKVNGGLAAPTLANLDGDADLEVVVGTIASGAVAYDLPNTANARVLWRTGRGGFLRSGMAQTAGCFVLNVVASPVSMGSVTATPPNCGAAYSPGTVVTLTATASVGNHFLAWNGISNETANPISLTMTADRSVTALFIDFVPTPQARLPVVVR
jgi:hypothetical protein